MVDNIQNPKAIILCASSATAPSSASEIKGLVELVVTSPPYHNAISYTSHADDPNLNYRERSLLDYGRDYLPMLQEVWDACWEMMAPGAVIAVNVGSVLESGYHYPLPLDIIKSFEDSNREWTFLKTVLWHKVTAGVKRAGSVIQHQLPGYWYPNIMTEHIILFQKPGEKLKLNSGVPDSWLQTVWDIAPVPPRKINHPAPYPEEIPHRLIRLFTDPGSWVMDPFNGAGATSKSAIDLGRNALGFDIEPKYVDLAKQRLVQGTGIRDQQLTMSIVPRGEFVPGKSQGKTRHGAGISTRKVEI